MAEFPCPWCEVPIPAPAYPQATRRTWTSGDDAVQERSLAHIKASCEACGKRVRRDSVPGAPWTPLYQEGDRVLGPHPMDAVSGRRYVGTVTATRSRRAATGETTVMVTVEYDQTDMFGAGKSAEVVAEAVTPAQT